MGVATVEASIDGIPPCFVLPSIIAGGIALCIVLIGRSAGMAPLFFPARGRCFASVARDPRRMSTIVRAVAGMLNGGVTGINAMRRYFVPMIKKMSRTRHGGRLHVYKFVVKLFFCLQFLPRYTQQACLRESSSQLHGSSPISCGVPRP